MTVRLLILLSVIGLANGLAEGALFAQQGAFPNRPDPYAPNPPVDNSYAQPATGNAPYSQPNYAPQPPQNNGPSINAPPPSVAPPGDGNFNPGFDRIANVPRTPPPAVPLRQFEPGKIVAVVGDQYILAGDVQPLASQTLEPFLANAKSEFERSQIEDQRPILEAQLTKQLIDTKLLYLEFERQIPKEKIPEVQKSVRKSFEKDLFEGREKIVAQNGDQKKIQEVIRKDPLVLRIAALMEEKQLQTLGQLDLELKQYGGSLEQYIRAYGEQRLGRMIIAREINFEPMVSHDEMLRYYEEKIADYSYPAQVRWEVIMVRKENFRTREEAFNTLAGLGNEVFFGAPFAAVAKRSSQGYDAAQGGVQDWTVQGALASKPLDQAIFTLPEGRLSQIIEDEKGLYIVRVTEHKPAGKTSFTEVQDELKEKIQLRKKEEQYKEFMVKLREKTPVWSIYDEGNALNPNNPGN